MLDGERLLAEVEVGDLALGAQDVEAGGLGALVRLGQVFAGLLDGPPAFLLVLLELPRAGLEVSQPLLALGQLDLDFGSLVVGPPPAPPAAGFAGRAGQGSTPSRPSAASICFRSSRASARRPAAASCCPWASCSSRIERGPLLVQLGASLLGGGDGHAVLGQGVGGLLVFGRAAVDEALLRGDLLVQLGRRRSAPRRSLSSIPRVATGSPATGCAARSGRSRRSAARRSACRRVRAIRRRV